jgi:hypothetical protein
VVVFLSVAEAFETLSVGWPAIVSALAKNRVRYVAVGFNAKIERMGFECCIELSEIDLNS